MSYWTRYGYEYIYSMWTSVPSARQSLILFVLFGIIFERAVYIVQYMWLTRVCGLFMWLLCVGDGRMGKYKKKSVEKNIVHNSEYEVGVSDSLLLVFFMDKRWSKGMNFRSVKLCRMRLVYTSVPYVRLFVQDYRAALWNSFSAYSKGRRMFSVGSYSTEISAHQKRAMMVQHRCTSKWKRFSMRWCIHDGFVWEICYAFWFFPAI